MATRDLLLNFHSAIISNLAQLLRLTVSEVVLLVLLVTFSLVTSSGFWRTLQSLAYIYFFPLVLFWYACYGCYVALRAFNRWVISQTNPGARVLAISAQRMATESHVVAAPVPICDDDSGGKNRATAILHMLLRPFRRFTFLWCFLLLVTTHLGVLWVSLIVVLLHVGRAIARVLKVAFLSGPRLAAAGQELAKTASGYIAKLEPATEESLSIKELNTLLGQLRLVEIVTGFLCKRELVIAWAWLIAVLSLGVMYVYIAGLFSFVYYGIARVSGIAYSWPEAFVTSIFIPFLIGDLPKIAAAKLLGGIQCTLVLTVGIGTLINYFRRHLVSIRTGADDIRSRFGEQSTREKYLLLKEKAATTSTAKPAG